jgi:hypothetical protein
MEVDEYFRKGKMYVFGKWSRERREYARRIGANPREYFIIEGAPMGSEGYYYPKSGDYFMCLGLRKKVLRGKGKDGSDVVWTVIKFLSPDTKVVLDSCTKIGRFTLEKWMIAPEHLEKV